MEIREALTFDDVLLVPGASSVLPADAIMNTYVTQSIGLNIPILSSGEQLSKITRAKIELEKSTLQLSELEKKLNIEINLAKGNYQFAIEDYYNKKRSLELSERIERKNQIKFTEGIASSFDLRDAQTQLYKTQQSYLMSMLSIINSKAKLESLTSENNQN